MRFRALSALALLSIFAAVAAGEETTVKGPAVTIGNGKAWTWTKLVDGKPASIGVSFDDKALTGLPTDLPMPAGMDMPGMMPSQEFVLEFPKEIKGMPYDHMGIDWNPKGHIPAGIYDKPHFDFHFYFVSPQEREGIKAVGDDMSKCMKQPDSQFVPCTYILPPGTAVPKMGVHWVDPMTPELNGKPFTQTFIYGSYDGKSTFLEPMMTLEYLQSKPKLNKSVWPPMAYDRDGYFPTRYSVSYDEASHEYTVALDNLVMRKAGGPLIQIQEIAPGDGAEVKSGDTVELHYTGMFPDGKKFDSSLDRNETFTIKSGAGQVIKGFDMGVLGMKKGGKRRVTIPPELGYGARGAGNVIPPNATLVFELEVVSIK